MILLTIFLIDDVHIISYMQANQEINRMIHRN
jgi:hypothetical protein